MGPLKGAKPGVPWFGLCFNPCTVWQRTGVCVSGAVGGKGETPEGVRRPPSGATRESVMVWPGSRRAPWGGRKLDAAELDVSRRTMD